MVEFESECWFNPEIDKTAWGEGPWNSEPDKAQAVSEQGYPCLFLRHPNLGHWCAYVGVSKSHPAYGLSLSEAMDHVDSAVTYSSLEKLADPPEAGYCFVPVNDREPLWLIGVDFAHFDHFSPGVAAMLGETLADRGCRQYVQLPEAHSAAYALANCLERMKL